MVTLNLTDTQVIMLDALFRNHSSEEIIDLIEEEFKEFFEDNVYSPSTYAYAIEASNTPNWIYLNDDGALYNILNDAVYNIGLAHQDKAMKILNNKAEEILNK